MSPRLRTALVWIFLVLVFFGAYSLLSNDEPAAVHASADAFYADLDAHRIAQVSIDRENHIYAHRGDGSEYRVDGLSYTEPLSERFARDDVQVAWHEESDAGSSTFPLIIVGVLVLVLAAFVFVLRRIQGQGVLALRKTTARLVSQKPNVGWNDVGGSADAKVYLRDTVDFLKSPGKWEAAGARPPRGILLEGPPGYGKTLLAKALAGEAKLPFFEVSGSEFVELFVGVGAARVRDLFDEAKKKAPCVVFIDELDAVGRKRGGAGATLTHQEREQALDQLLVCLDGFSGRSRVVVVAATNRADVLDPALLRPGRFDIVLRVGDFTEADRRAVLDVHMRNKPAAKDIDLDALAAMTPEASGADLEQITNMAAMAVARRGEATPKITQEDLERAAESLRPKSSQLDKLDTLLAAATSGVAQPSAPLRVTVHTRTSGTHEGALVWADPYSLKIVTVKASIVLSRNDVVAVAAHADVAAVGANDVLRVPAAQQPDAG